MIYTKTLFILGAGASRPFGYPTGSELRTDIFKNRQNQAIINALNREEMDPNFFSNLQTDFLNNFMQSSVYSIDSFLEHRTEFMEIGKMNIASNLIIHEHDSMLRRTENNWYMYLFDRIKLSFEQLNKNNISFITFNYDRSLEQFFFEAIRYRFGEKPATCAEMLKNIPIVHLYGQLDLLPWQGSDGQEYSPNKKLTSRLRASAQNIKLISDERDVKKSEEFQKAYDLIGRADLIIFLGFGFDETNLERLNISLMKGKRVISTGLGLEPTKSAWVKSHFVDKGGVSISIQDRDSLSLLHHHLDIE